MKQKFWETDDGKIISHTVHDHSNAVGSLKTNIELIRMYQKNGKLTPELLEDRLEKMLNAVIRAQKAVDYSYDKFKEKYNKQLN